MVEIDKLVAIFKNDKLLNNMLKKYYIIKSIFDYEESLRGQVSSINDIMLYNIAELLYENREYVLNNEIMDLIMEDFLKEDFSRLFSIKNPEDELLHQIFYSFKYSNVKNFFFENYKRFLPEIDIIKIEASEKVNILQKSLMKEFDKLSSIIEDMANLQDIDKIPVDYVKYLAQLLGYEKEETYLINDEKYRVLIKNIVQLYKIKGTNYSLELFFNFLGYNLEIFEYWFDRRYTNYIYPQNPFTGETNKSSFMYYLTPYNPAKTLPANVYPKEYVITGDISKQLNLFNFNLLANIYDPEVLLGYKKNYGSYRYEGDKFKYFKTNVVEFRISVLPDSNISTGEKELESLRKYIEFLTPINITKVLTFASLYPEENAWEQIINGVVTSALRIDDNEVGLRAAIYSDSIGDPRLLFEQSTNGIITFEYSTDYDPVTPERATWTNEFTVSPVWLRISVDEGSTWTDPIFFDTDPIVENTLFFDYANSKRGTLGEKSFNAFFILAREPENELSNLASYYSLASSKGKLHSGSISRRVRNDSQIKEMNIERIVWQTPIELGAYSEVWVLKPYTTFNPFRGTQNNKIEIRNTEDRTLSGIYNVLSSRTVAADGKIYFVITIENIPFKQNYFENSGDQGFGGTVGFITTDGYPIYSITRLNERGNSVIKIINPYPRKIPNITYKISSKSIFPSSICIRYADEKNICNRSYEVRRFYFTETTSPKIVYLNIETELMTELQYDYPQTGFTSKGILFIDKQNWSLGRKKHNLLDDDDFRWFKYES